MTMVCAAAAVFRIHIKIQLQPVAGHHVYEPAKDIKQPPGRPRIGKT